MRLGFGLLSLLIGVAILFYISFGGEHGGEMGVTLQANKNATEQGNQIAGRSMDGTPIEGTIQLDEVDAGGEFRRLKVLSITPGTPMDTAYGLKPGDEITRVGDLGVRDNNDAGLAKTLVYGAYQNNQPLGILRNGEEMTLTPDSPLTKFHPNLFGKPGAVVNPNSASPLSSGQSIPSH